MRLRMHRSYAVTAMKTVPRERPGPLTTLWRWRYEAGFVVGFPAVVLALTDMAGLVPVIAALVAGGALVGLWPAARKAVWSRIRCVVTAHRVRTGFVEAVVVNMRGKIPMVLWATPAPYGERVWLWCRAGTTPKEIHEGREILAATCWAREVRVRPHPRRPHVVLLEVVRHEPAVVLSARREPVIEHAA